MLEQLAESRALDKVGIVLHTQIEEFQGNLAVVREVIVNLCISDDIVLLQEL